MWKKCNPDKDRASKNAYRLRNIDKVKAYNKAWAKSNAGKVTAYARKYQLAKIRAMPKWVDEKHIKEIEAFYINRPKDYHVDHIVPIQGKDVCGLHVVWNLQYFPLPVNIEDSKQILT